MTLYFRNHFATLYRLCVKWTSGASENFLKVNFGKPEKGSRKFSAFFMCIQMKHSTHTQWHQKSHLMHKRSIPILWRNLSIHSEAVPKTHVWKDGPNSGVVYAIIIKHLLWLLHILPSQLILHQKLTQSIQMQSSLFTMPSSREHSTGNWRYCRRR